MGVRIPFAVITWLWTTLAYATCPTSTESVRFATFNVYLNRPTGGVLYQDLLQGDPQAFAVAEIIQRVRPHVLLLNEFDYDASGKSLAEFQSRYLNRGQNGAAAIEYPYVYLAPSNTGIPADIDVNGDGVVEGPTDRFGYGAFPGQYGMALLSMFPIDEEHSRTFQTLLWQNMPNNNIPNDFYTESELNQFRLSSKSHWDVSIVIEGKTVHALAAHPTPPIFDGPDDHNGRRNHDEIRLWADYISGGAQAAYITDDTGRSGGLAEDARFVVLGDYNADPKDGDSRLSAINQLLDHARVNPAHPPKSSGSAVAAQTENTKGQGDPATDTSDFSQNLRLDYALPSRYGLTVTCSGVFWPGPNDPLRRLVGDGENIVSSDHRMVWVDVTLEATDES